MRYTNYKYNQRATKILQIVTEFPGLTFTEIMNCSGLANGVLSHYLVNMEKHAMLRSVRSKKNARYFLLDQPTSDDSPIINLRKETCRNVLVFLLTKKQASFGDIVLEVKRSPPTVSITLSHLVGLGLIKASIGFGKKFEIVNRQHVMEVLQKIEPTTFDKIKENFADTFSYF
jgi:predicted transcriptional regulator